MNKTLNLNFSTLICVECGRFKKPEDGKLWATPQRGTYEFICYECENRIFLEAEGGEI